MPRDGPDYQYLCDECNGILGPETITLTLNLKNPSLPYRTYKFCDWTCVETHAREEVKYRGTTA